MTSRQPRQSELGELIKLYRANLVNGLDAKQDIAMTQVASLLLNLDESLTK